MTQVTLYTTKVCPYCVKAKSLLKQKGIENYQEIDVTDNMALREEMMQKAGGRRSVPQIFINGQHVGGCDDLYALNDAGKLDALLAG